MRSVAKPGFSILNVKIHRFVAYSSKEYSVISTPFYGGREIAAAVRVTPAAGEGGFPHNHPSAGKKTARTGQKTGDKTQDIIRAEWISARGYPVEEHISGKPDTGQVFLIYIVRHRFLVYVPRSEVNH